MTTKEKIFEAALDLFAEKGFQATSIRDITGRTGLSVAAFYNHFKSKNDLLQAVYDYYSGLFTGTGRNQPDYASLLDQMSPAELFGLINQQIVASLRDEKLVKLTRVIVNEQYTNKIAGEIAARDRQILLTALENLLVIMSEKGLITVKDPHSLGRLVGFAYLGFAGEHIHHSILGNQDPAELVQGETALIQAFLREIAAVTAPGNQTKPEE